MKKIEKSHGSVTQLSHGTCNEYRKHLQQKVQLEVAILTQSQLKIQKKVTFMRHTRFFTGDLNEGVLSNIKWGNGVDATGTDLFW